MSVIKGAVGPGKLNHADDVRTIQRLLNSRMVGQPGFIKLKEDGRFGPNTAHAILDFQSKIIHAKKTDGIVDAHGPTIVALTATGPTHHAVPAHVTSFIQMALPAAKKVKATWSVPIAAVIAQSALETGWGRAVKNNAYFGIKGKATSTGASTTFNTTEVVNGKVIHIKDAFRAYKDYAESADDYGRFLSENSRYKAAFLHKNDAVKFIQEVAKAGYATDPDYAKSLTAIINSYNLEQYDR